MVTVERTTTLDSLVDAASQRFVEVVESVQSNGSDARVVLTGGTAGIRVLEALREDSGQIDWQRVHVFFGDERNVPVTHEDSNEGQARAALLDHVDIPADRIHSYRLGELDMESSAEFYTGELEKFAPEGFDIHLLGMGGEGHINTLFPGTAAVRETEKLVVAEYNSPKPPSERVTLTLPAVARAQRVWLLVSGAEKAEAAGHVARRSDPVDWPAAGAQGQLETVLFVTEDAATDIA